MKKIYLVAIAAFANIVSASEYPTPLCYAQDNPTCSFNQMTLDLCNLEGKSTKTTFLINKRLYEAGGNKFESSDGKHICTVKGIKGTDPKRYSVIID